MCQVNIIKKRSKKNFCVIYYIKTMETYCVICNKNTENKNSSETKQNRLMLLSNCAVRGKNKLTFIKNRKLHNFDISND